MKKSCLPGKIVLGILALLFLLIFALMPLVYDLLLPFQKMSYARGVWGSPFVGLENFRQLFGMPNFLNALGNTLLLNWPPLVLATGLAFLSAWLVRVIRGNTGRAIWLMGAGLLSFLPAQLFIAPLVYAVVGNGINPTLAYLFMCLLAFLRLAGPAALLGGAVSVYTVGGKGRFAGVFFFILYGLAGLFTNGSEAFFLNIASIDSTMTLSMYIYQMSMLMANYSGGAAANLLRTLPQLVLAAVGFLAMLRLLKRPQPVVPQRTQKGLSLAGIILLCVGGALFVAFIVWGVLDRGIMPTANTVSLAIAGCAYFTLLAVAGGLLSFQARKPVVVLVMLLLGAVGGGVAGQYLHAINMGLLNTALPAAVYGALSMLPLAAGAAYLFYRGGRAAVAHTFPMVGIAVATLLTDHLNNSIYFSNRQMMPYAGQAYAAMAESGTWQTPAASYVLTLLCLAVWLISFAFLFKRNLAPGQIEALNQPRMKAPAMAAPGMAAPMMQGQPGQPMPGGQVYPGGQPPAAGQPWPQAGYTPPPYAAGQAPYPAPQQAPPPPQPWPANPGQPPQMQGGQAPYGSAPYGMPPQAPGPVAQPVEYTGYAPPQPQMDAPAPQPDTAAPPAEPFAPTGPAPEAPDAPEI